MLRPSAHFIIYSVIRSSFHVAGWYSVILGSEPEAEKDENCRTKRSKHQTEQTKVDHRLLHHDTVQ